MTDLITENARLRDALEKALNYIENTESELGITLDCGDTARATLATPAPDAVQEAAKVLLSAPYGDMQSAFHAIETARDADEGPEETFAQALRAIAGGQP